MAIHAAICYRTTLLLLDGIVAGILAIIRVRSGGGCIHMLSADSAGTASQNQNPPRG